jgi:hypothetical protein
MIIFAGEDNVQTTVANLLGFLLLFRLWTCFAATWVEIVTSGGADNHFAVCANC